MNSRQKGKRGERQARDLFRDAGLIARRGQQFSGGNESPDIIVPALADTFHFEVKYVQGIHSAKLKAAVLQAKGDAPTKQWVILSKENHGEWYATIPAKELVRLMAEAVPPFSYVPPTASTP